MSNMLAEAINDYAVGWNVTRASLLRHPYKDDWEAQDAKADELYTKFVGYIAKGEFTEFARGGIALIVAYDDAGGEMPDTITGEEYL